MQYEIPDPPPIDHYKPYKEQMRQYAEQAVSPLLAEIERLKRGEFICNSCGLRKNADTQEANF